MTQKEAGRSIHAQTIRVSRARRRLSLLGVLALVALLVGCSDDFNFGWAVDPGIVDLYSLARPELNLPSAFSFYQRQTYRVEGPSSSGAWDIAVDTREGALVFLPPSALGIGSLARIAPLSGAEFEEVKEAPRDSAQYVKSDPVLVEIGRVYVVQSGLTAGTFGGTCVRYAKMEPVEMDVDTGYLSILYDTNPLCNDRRLIPPS